MSGEAPKRRAFRWQNLLQESTEAVFVLDSRRRLLFVNECFERLAGVTCDHVRGLLCRKVRSAVAEPLIEDALAGILAPPPEVLTGQFVRTRRLWRGGQCWDLEFLPLRHEEGSAVLGRVLVVAADVVKPVALPERLVTLRQRASERYSFDLLESKTPAMARLVRQVRVAIETRSPVLILGEVGVGKETVARIIHHQGRDRERAFCAVDCDRLPIDAIANVVLGEKLDIAALYLRQPGALPRELQLLLCARLADERGPRLLAGSTFDTSELVRQGKMLIEFANFLSPLTLEVPSLRERRDDLPRLIARMTARQGVVRVPTPAALDVMRAYAWQENLTELYATLLDCAERVTGERIDVGDLPLALRVAERPTPPIPKQPPLPELLEQVERRLIELALRRARGNRTKAAEALGIFRNQLSRRMKALGMDEGEEKA